jgi:uncharacterized protein (DUF1697 family)
MMAEPGRTTMARWIALFRGINVVGNNLLPMASLVRHLEALKLKNIKTYIQSGNVVFDTTSKNLTPLTKSIVARIEEEHGFAPRLLLLSPDALQQAINDNPFPHAASEPKSLHFFFLEKPSTNPNTKALELAKAKTESYVLTDLVFYLHAPDGIGRSKLASTAEKHLGVAATARNLRTVEKLMALALES